MNSLPHDHAHGNAFFPMTLPSKEESEQLCALFKLLSDPCRLKLFWLLCHCEECVINLSAILQMTSPALSHHLKLLKSAGVILSRREGKEVYYRACTTPAAQALHDAIEQIFSITCPKQQA